MADGDSQECKEKRRGKKNGESGGKEREKGWRWRTGRKKAGTRQRRRMTSKKIREKQKMMENKKKYEREERIKGRGKDRKRKIIIY